MNCCYPLAMTEFDDKTLPIIHARRERRPADLFKIEQLDLEFSNGERRTYERLMSRGWVRSSSWPCRTRITHC